MTREELAARLFVALHSTHERAMVYPELVFQDVDKFLAYDEKQRKQPEPVQCDCGPWEGDPNTNKYKRKICAKCIGLDKKEPSPNRQAREWNLFGFPDGHIRAYDAEGVFVEYKGKDVKYLCKVREILE